VWEGWEGEDYGGLDGGGKGRLTILTVVRVKIGDCRAVLEECGC